MKKFTKIFAFAMALMMVFALQAPVSAAEKGAVIEAGVEAPEAHLSLLLLLELPHLLL